MSVQTSYFPLEGGLDLVTQALSIKPGRCMFAENYECAVFGGYRRLEGYERLDGRPAPSLASYWALDFESAQAAITEGEIITGAISGASAEVIVAWELAFDQGITAFLPGETVTGAVSGATGVVLAVGVDSGDWATDDAEGHLYLIQLTGTFQAEVITSTEGKASALGAAIDPALASGSYAGADGAGTLAITGLSGSFQAGEGLTVGGVQRALASSPEVERGAADDTQDAAWIRAARSAARIKIQAVPGSGPIRGVAYFKGTAYAFRDNAAGTECVMHKSTPSGWTVVTTPVLNPGGRYEFVISNFKGHAGLTKFYGCDGKNKAFEFDGTTFTQITTGMTTDTPAHIAAHHKHLFLTFAGGSLQHSSPGDPTGTWTPVTGAGEITPGDEITAIVTQPGGTLAVFGRNQTHILYGTGSSDWALKELSSESGAREWTAQRIGMTRYLDDRGLTEMGAVQNFGDFATNTFSQHIQPLLKAKRATVTTSQVIKEKSQYRLYFDNGTGLICTFDGARLAGITTLRFPHVVRTAFSGETSAGAETILFGSDDGWVFQLEKGTSFDGAFVTAFLRLPFNHFKSPRTKKRFRKLILELESQLESSLFFSPDFNYGSNTVPAYSVAEIEGGGGYWNIADWDEFVWTSQTVAQAESSITGIGINMGLYIYTHAVWEAPHLLQGVLIHYSHLGLAR